MSAVRASAAPALAPAVAAVVATGDELVSGSTLDTNSGQVARALLELGFEIERIVVLGDDEAALAGVLRDLCARCAVVVVTGGLGPTLDDVTRHAVASASGRALVSSADTLADLKAGFAGRGRPFPASNERQALFPEGAEILENPHGTAPGFALTIGRAHVFALPGPPREMVPMLEAHVLPRLRVDTKPLARAAFHLFGLAEGVFADRAGAWMARDAEPRMGVTVAGGVLTVRLIAGAGARDAVLRRAAEVRERFGEWIFSETEPDLARALGRELIARGVRVATAESCTGGLLAERLTRVPGISAVFHAGWVAYGNRAKTELLGVDPALIDRHGAVSAEVAQAMARGAAERSGARLAASITGVAGPDGGTPEKPVGLVWLGLFEDGSTRAEERRFAVRGRDLIREFAANTALDLLRRSLLALPARH